MIGVQAERLQGDIARPVQQEIGIEIPVREVVTERIEVRADEYLVALCHRLKALDLRPQPLHHTDKIGPAAAAEDELGEQDQIASVALDGETYVRLSQIDVLQDAFFGIRPAGNALKG